MAQNASEAAARPNDAPPSRESAERAAARARAAASTAPGSNHGPRAVTAIALRAFEALAENVRDYAIFLMDRDGVITFWGEGARLMKWWSKAEAEGSHLRLLYPDGGSDDGTAEAHIVEAAERGEYTGEGRRVRTDGSTFWAGVTLTALRGEDGVLHGFAKVTRDLTAARAADAALRAASDAAEAARTAAESANRAKSGFLATMSHEIRTPVNAILGYHELLALELAGPLTAAQRTYLERARLSGRHLLALIDDVLDLSRLEADRVPVVRSVVRVGAAVDAALSILAPQAHAREVVLDDAVSGYAGAVACWADDERVRQILVNLLSNAIKFTPAGGRVRVSAGLADQPPADVAVQGSGPWCYVRVEDTGVGIARDQLAAIFEPFVQADMSHTRVHGGTGLGLAISRRLARLMGGDLVGRSEPGTGATFFLWLRAAPAVGAPGARDVATSAAEGGGRAPADDDLVTAPRPLGAFTAALLGDVDRILHAVVARLRSDPSIPSAQRVADRDLEDHLATFLADVTHGVAAVESPEELTPEALRDGIAIQRLVAERHGRQRAGLGWAADEVQREFEIIGEELAAAVHRRAPADPLRGGHPVEDALALLRECVSAAERASLASLAAAREQGRPV
jgi:PAS domain S-box-containing protein